jgi:hypothetical protein
MTNLTISEARLHHQHLSRPPLDRPEDVVHWLGAVQAQDYAGAKWAIAQRSRTTSETELDRLFNDGLILRTHVMRPTWHFVTPADIRWLLGLTAPRVNAISAYYYRKFELDDAVFRRSNAAIVRALRDGKQRTRAELGQALKSAGLFADGLRLSYLVFRAELEGIVCSGALRGKQFTYALLDDRVPPTKRLTRDEALAELASRYFSSHGPALLQDFAWWSCLTISDANAGAAMARPALKQETIDGKTYWFSSLPKLAPQKKPTVYLLPNYDEYLIAYKERSASFDQSLITHPDQVKGALWAHIVVLNGMVVGGWRRSIKKQAVTIETKLLLKLDQEQQKALKAAAERYGQFLGKPVILI